MNVRRQFDKEPRPAKYSPRDQKKGGSDPSLWAVEPPQTRFARILATGSLPPLMEVKSVCILHGKTHASFEAAGQGENEQCLPTYRDGSNEPSSRSPSGSTRIS